MRSKIYFTIFMMIMVFALTGCLSNHSTTITREKTIAEETEPILYEVMLYNNQGDNFLTVEGKDFTLYPNKIKQFGYNTDGSWVSYYETSSVVTINIDENYIQTCGSTVIFKDTRLTMLEIPSELRTVSAGGSDAYTVTEDNRVFDSHIGLKLWWYDIGKKGQHGEKVVIIQSQDGYNIGAFAGADITWEVVETLPKTTRIMVDGLPLYIHRCNFTIIDSALIDKSLD